MPEPRLPSIDEAHAAQFDRALKEFGGPVGAVLAGLEIEDVPIDLHEMWEAMLRGAQYLQLIGQEIDRWMSPYRVQWEREQQAAAQARRDVTAESKNSIAPWTDDEVQSLNAYQASSAMHPFTCENDDANYCASVLVATPDGWTCPDCDYTQNWAKTWMANWAWRKALETGLGAWVPGSIGYDAHAERPSRIRTGGVGA